MQTLNNHLKKRLADRFLGKQAVGVLVLRFLHTQFPHIDPIGWYIRHHKLFVSTDDQQTKIVVFARKRELLTQINKHLADMWYNQTIRDIIFVTKKISSGNPDDIF
jgi:hypothetical protein